MRKNYAISFCNLPYVWLWVAMTALGACFNSNKKGSINNQHNNQENTDNNRYSKRVDTKDHQESSISNNNRNKTALQPQEAQENREISEKKEALKALQNELTKIKTAFQDLQSSYNGLNDTIQNITIDTLVKALFIPEKNKHQVFDSDRKDVATRFKRALDGLWRDVATNSSSFITNAYIDPLFNSYLYKEFGLLKNKDLPTTDLNIIDDDQIVIEPSISRVLTARYDIEINNKNKEYRKQLERYITTSNNDIITQFTNLVRNALHTCAGNIIPVREAIGKEIKQKYPHQDPKAIKIPELLGLSQQKIQDLEQTIQGKYEST